MESGWTMVVMADGGTFPCVASLSLTPRSPDTLNQVGTYFHTVIDSHFNLDPR